MPQGRQNDHPHPITVNVFSTLQKCPLCFLYLSKGQKKDNLCCKRCSCEADCWRTESCCIDTDVHLADKPEVLHCKESLVKRDHRDNTIYDGTYDGVKRYRIIDYCPFAWNTTTLNDKCIAKHPTSLDEYVWVSDKMNGIIYQNKYCAECHGVEDFINWQIWAKCPEVFHPNFSSLFQQISADTCSFNMEAPKDFHDIVEPFTCFIYNYERCNQTGLWETFDADLLSGCIKFDSPVLYRIKSHYVSYKNVFCYLCNGGDPDGLQMFCPEELFKEKGMVNKLSVLINFDKYSTLQDSGNDNADADADDTTRCRSNEVFDIYMEICRELICPYGKTPFYGSCEQWTLETHGLSIAMGFNFKVKGYSNSSVIHAHKHNQEPLGQKIISKFKNAIGQKKATCQTCSFSLYAAIKNDTSIPTLSTFYIFAIFSTKTKCQLEDLDILKSRFVGKKLKVFITATGYVTLLPDLELRTESEVNHMYQFMARKSYAGVCIPAISFSFQLFCPAVDLYYLELASYYQPEKKAKLAAFFEAKQHKSGAMRVCLTEYNAFMSPKTSAATFPSSFMQSLPIILIIIIYFCKQEQ